MHGDAGLTDREHVPALFGNGTLEVTLVVS
jgi:hypothetical protein